MSSDDFDNADQFGNNYEEVQQQESTEALKLQIKLNHLINNHKAPLKLYDDIVNLFNEYMSSNNFNRYARLKSRKSFIKAYESTYNVTHLRWKHKNAVLTDGAEVTVPVFDAKSMILDLITNPGTMHKMNIVAGYDVLTGNVDETLPEPVSTTMNRTWNAISWMGNGGTLSAMRTVGFLWKYTRDHVFEDVLTAFEVSGCKFWQCLGDTVAAQQLDPLDPQLWIKGG